MSERYTVATYVEGKLVDIDYYRNWNMEYVFLDALAMAAFFYDCRTEKAFVQKKYDNPNAETLEDVGESERVLRFTEQCSEWPLVLDLTAQCFYVSSHGLTGEALEKKPILSEKLENYGYDVWYQRKIDGERFPERAIKAMPFPINLSDYIILRKPIPARKVTTLSDLIIALYYCRVSFEGLDMDYLVKLFKTSEEMRFVSKEAKKMLARMS